MTCSKYSGYTDNHIMLSLQLWGLLHKACAGVDSNLSYAGNAIHPLASTYMDKGEYETTAGSGFGRDVPNCPHYPPKKNH